MNRHNSIPDYCREVRRQIDKRLGTTDAEALETPDLYYKWAPDTSYKADTILNHNGTLYRVVQDVVSQSHQPPDAEGMLAIYRPITVDHAGTADDPIPWVYGMDCHNGKYYAYNDVLYLCKQDMIPCTWAPGTDGVWQWEKIN